MNIDKWNKELQGKDPIEIVQFFSNRYSRTVVTTNFRPYETAILYACFKADINMPVIWCDSGYNTKATYQHVKEVLDLMPLQIKTYIPKNTKAFRDVYLGVPNVNDPKHSVFTEELKLEPFKRAMADFKPEVWFTNIRKGQTALRDSLDIVSLSQTGVIKVSPFYHYSKKDLDAYISANNLPIEWDYSDPTKVESTRECGLHIKL